jgi:hypothetical protein
VTVQLDPVILSEALELGMEWALEKPLQDALRALHPGLSDAELAEYDRVRREAMDFGYDRVYAFWALDRPVDGAFTRWSEEFLARFPWATEHNLTRLFSQGCFYVWK